MVTRAASTDSTLGSLSLSGITLVAGTGGFASGTESYVATVPHSMVQTTVAAVTTHERATYKITPPDADGDADGHQVNLVAGATPITVTVTAEDGMTESASTAYTVTVTRAPPADATLKTLKLTVTDGAVVALSPAFASSGTAYSASVAATVSMVTVYATPRFVDSTVAIFRTDTGTDVPVIGTDVALGDSGGPITIEVRVTSGSVGTITVYKVEVFRVHTNTALDSLKLNGGTALDPVTGSATRYEASVARSVAQVTVEAEAEALADSLTISPDDADDTVAGHQVDLEVGANPITVNVTDGGGMTTPYTLTVTRAAATDATLGALSLSGITLDPAFDAATLAYTADVAGDVASTTVTATAAHASADVDGQGRVDLTEGANLIQVTVTAEDGSTMTYTVNVARAVVETVVETVTVPGPTRTKTVTETVIVEVPAAPAAAGVIGSTAAATATEVNGQVMITRHDGGASLVVNLGGFIRDDSFGQTYQVVRRMDGAIVRQWVSPNSPLVYQIPWAVVISQFNVPVGVVGAIPLDDQAGAPGQLVRRFDGGDDRIFSYDGMGGWRHVPDIPTFQALGLYWCDVTAADAGFFDRITIGSPHAATGMPARSDYPNCSTG